MGLGEASVERICDRAGFTRGAFYSNFASKDEMFLELAAEFARERVASVRARIGEIESAHGIDMTGDGVAMMIRALDGVGDDRLTTLLMHEINIRAMRDAEFAAAFRTQNEAIVAEVVQLIHDIVERGCLRLRIPTPDAARMLLAVWVDAESRAAISHQASGEVAEQRTQELSRIVGLVLE